jgi:hypothetical protein
MSQTKEVIMSAIVNIERGGNIPNKIDSVIGYLRKNGTEGKCVIAPTPIGGKRGQRISREVASKWSKHTAIDWLQKIHDQL